MMTSFNPVWMAAVIEMASRALGEALAQDMNAASLTVVAMQDQLGHEAVSVAMVAWCDATLAELAPGVRYGSRQVALKFHDDEAGLVGADDVNDVSAWAGRLVAARAAGDRAMFYALCAAIPDEEQGAHVLSLLAVAAKTIRLSQGRS